MRNALFLDGPYGGQIRALERPGPLFIYNSISNPSLTNSEDSISVGPRISTYVQIGEMRLYDQPGNIIALYCLEQ